MLILPWSTTAPKMRTLCLIGAGALMALGHCQAQTTDTWDKPAASLAAQVADTLGPGPAAFSMRNLSSIHSDQLASIRKSIEASLKSHGIIMGGPDSANSIRVTLSENVHESLWVAEVVEGNETKVAMVELGSTDPVLEKVAGAMTLRRQIVLTTQDPVLAALEVPSGVLVLEPEFVVLFGKAGNAWKELERAQLNITHALGRDPRGTLLGSANGSVFDAWLPGEHCAGNLVSALQGSTMKVVCGESDDPWAITQPPLGLVDSPSSQASANVMVTPIRAFYNAARNSFTGILVPNSGSDLSAFYSLAIIPRSSGFAILVNGVDGRVQLMENGAPRTVAGTRDWGSDVAALDSGCGAGTQVIVSGSGDAANDSLRAYEVPLLEAVPTSEPLQLEGSIKSLSSAPDGKSLLAIVRRANNTYEVDRVTALCN